jgi:hypothetical protein
MKERQGADRFSMRGLEQLMTAHAAGKLRFFAAHTALADTTAFAAFGPIKVAAVALASR